MQRRVEAIAYVQCGRDNRQGVEAVIVHICSPFPATFVPLPHHIDKFVAIYVYTEGGEGNLNMHEYRWPCGLTRGSHQRLNRPADCERAVSSDMPVSVPPTSVYRARVVCGMAYNIIVQHFV